MKSLILALGALFALDTHAQGVPDTAEIVFLKPEKVTLRFLRPITLPAGDGEMSMPVIRDSGLPGIQGQASCVLAGNAAAAGRSVIPAGTTFKVESITPDFYSDSGITIIKPAGIWGLGLVCVGKLAGYDEDTGFPESGDPETSIKLGEFKAALAGVIEVKAKR